MLWSICLVLMLAVVVAIVNYIVILHVKLEFDLSCQQVFWHCEQNDGLAYHRREELIETLERDGFESIVIHAPERGTVSKGERRRFSVTASKPLNRSRAFLESDQVKQKFTFEHFIVGRRIIH